MQQENLKTLEICIRFKAPTTQDAEKSPKALEICIRFKAPTTQDAARESENPGNLH
jgi:hypothetical protein